MPSKLVLDPFIGSDNTVIDQMSNALSIPIEVLNIDQLLPEKIKLDKKMQGLCLPVIGESLSLSENWLELAHETVS